MIKNSIYFIGTYIFSDMMEPIMDTYFNSYQYDFRLKSPFVGQDKVAIMRSDFR